MTEREKMLAGQLYDCGDAKLLTQWHKAKDLVRDYNQTDSQDAEEKGRILHELLGGHGKNLWITAPFYVDYGNNIYFGNNCEVNMNCTFLDDNKIVIGNMFEMFHWTKTRLQSRIEKDMQVERGVDNNGRTTDAKRRKEDKGRD